MQIIPVIDLKGGLVVRARAGDRDNYRPITTPLSGSPDPVDVMGGLLAIHPFPAVYVADLDAITGVGDNRAALIRLKARFPGQMFWVDNGAGSAERAAAVLEDPRDLLVLGSECQIDSSLVRSLAGHVRVVLSLDFRGDAFLGPPDILADSSCWPRHIIAMTLARVGGNGGADLDRLKQIKHSAHDRLVYAAGGVRDGADLAALGRIGIAGALVATCLHDGRLTGEDIAACAVIPKTTSSA
ncbi:HisA/HisF-related TIM barrel protein [Xanthobacteraceae bacterium Astr-EGSB]|uniref:HisA/HisF-related TIM barrel protein n=1 Tax=Astrobacterium formosum TaxID=3069710 RepID=UPI0027B2FFC9|nr:HisA/HisF-related TIM barrel protein [Xanthobacteraceae bacterium Astr-EGSB]